jgi:hypothetical protein
LPTQTSGEYIKGNKETSEVGVAQTEFNGAK